MGASTEAGAPPASLLAASGDYAEWLRAHGGSRVIRKILIANNGLGAAKCIRSMRRWAYMTFRREGVLHFVAMATPDDMAANAEYIRLADECVHVPGGSNRNNYANVELIVKGWGHASENPKLPATLAHHGIAFIGPGAEAMDAVGDKICANILAQSVGVAVIPWSGSGLTVAGTSIPADVLRRATVATADEAQSAARAVGYPLMVKASEGGGGKGIRKVCDAEALASAFGQVQAEVPGSPVFLQRLSVDSRHLEVQVLCDAHGAGVALYGRDCSVQRRHQKMLEEGPCTVAPPATLLELERGAVRLALKVGYVGAGTVEYLYNMKSGEYSFLEVNPRLQVEHPVTEAVTGVNLPAAQLLVACGVPLHRIPDVRAFAGAGAEGAGAGGEGGAGAAAAAAAAPDVDWGALVPRPPRGHCVAARITAEDPGAGFKPTSGRVDHLSFRDTPGVTAYFSVGPTHGGVHQFADSQFGHVFALAPTRDEAVALLACALQDLTVRGEVHTNAKYLQSLLEKPEFVAGTHDTAWLDGLIAAGDRPAGSVETHVAVVCGAVMVAEERHRGLQAAVLACLERGVAPEENAVNLSDHDVELIHGGLKYRLRVTMGEPTLYYVCLNGDTVVAEATKLPDGGLFVLLDGRTHTVYRQAVKSGWAAHVDGWPVAYPEDSDPTRLVAPSTGKLLRYLVPSGGFVAEGAPYAEVESMKMVMPLLATSTGAVTHTRQPGAALEAGDVLCTVMLDDPGAVRPVEPFSGRLPRLAPRRLANSSSFASPASGEGSSSYVRFQAALAGVRRLLAGYDCAGDPLGELLGLSASPQLAASDFDEQLAAVSARVLAASGPAALAALECVGASLRAAVAEWQGPARSLAQLDDVASAARSLAAWVAAQPGGPGAYEELDRFCGRYGDGLYGHECAVLTSFLTRYLDAELPFARAETFSDALLALAAQRRASGGDLAGVAEVAHSHAKVARKSALLLRVLDAVDGSGMADSEACLAALARFIELQRGPHAACVAAVAQRAKAIILRKQEESRDSARRWRNLQASLLGEPGAAGRVSVHHHHHAAGRMSHLGHGGGGGGGGDGDGGRAGCGPRSALVQPSLSRQASRSAAGAGPGPRVSFNTAPGGGGGGGAFPYGLRASPPSSLDRSASHAASAAAAAAAAVAAVADAGGPASVPAGGAVASPSAAASRRGSVDSDYPSLPEGDGAEDGEDGAGAPLYWAALFDFASPDTQLAALATAFAALGVPDATAHAQAGTVTAELLPGCRAYLAPSLSAVPALLRAHDAAAHPEAAFLVAHPALGSTSAAALPPLVADLLRSAPPPEGLDTAWFVLLAHGCAPAALAFVRGRGGYGARGGSSGGGGGGGGAHRRTGSSGGGEEEEPWREEPLLRGCLPTLAHQLELTRLSTFAAAGLSLLEPRGGGGGGHSGAATPRGGGSGAASARDNNALRFFRPAEYRLGVFLAEERGMQGKSGRDRRLFVRAAVYNKALLLPRRDGVASPAMALFSSLSGLSLSRAAAAAADAAGLGGQPRRRPRRGIGSDNVLADVLGSMELAVGQHHTAWNFIFVNLVDGGPEDVEAAEEVVHAFTEQCFDDLRRLKVAWVEVKVGPGRVVAQNKTSYHYSVEYHADAAPPRPYPALTKLQRKRMVAQQANTTYCYDFLDLFARSVRAELQRVDPVHMHEHELPPFTAAELALAPGSRTRLEPVSRPPGCNDVGVVAWRCTYASAAYPEGRDVVLVANDITHASGSFSPAEDDVFCAAYRLAQAEGLPCVYISANSGARIGLDEAVKGAFKAAWVDPSDPAQGFRYLYLDDADYKYLRETGSAVAADRVVAGPDGVGPPPSGAARWQLRDVPGGLGVECLQGSGAIARAASEAYTRTFTLTYVTARSVGVGAYVSRLGRRVIQNADAPLILTGASALNKLLGRDVYTSNNQIGGPKVMHANGVSHAVVPDDVSGVDAILRWLAYVPRRAGAPLPHWPSADPVRRPPGFTPTRGAAYDPRDLLAGFFDRGSFTECMADWGKSVVAGRACLGGLPLGVVAVETRTSEKTVPADPAFAGAQQTVEQQAGQVWFPDSAFKTAQAIRDFDGEGLPLLIFANWRGFAGGLRDMFGEVLKFGAMIVDALRVYGQPVMVYIPAHGELRGGAWVVIDATINPTQMELFASDTARGGVLEPEGIVDIKFRREDLMRAMRRTVPQLGNMAPDKAASAERDLLPLFKQVAVEFAALHDTPGVMRHKGAVSAVVPWAESREFFARHLRARLAAERLRRDALAASPALDLAQLAAVLAELKPHVDAAVAEDGPVTMDSPELRAYFRQLRSRHIRAEVGRLYAEDGPAVRAAVPAAANGVSP